VSQGSLSGGQVTLGIVGDASNFSKSVEEGVAAEEGFFTGLGKKFGGLLLSGFAAIGIGTRSATTSSRASKSTRRSTP